jgi:cytochrome b561
LAGLHAAAALFHHYIIRDSVLARMVSTRDS